MQGKGKKEEKNLSEWFENYRFNNCLIKKPLIQVIRDYMYVMGYLKAY